MISKKQEEAAVKLINDFYDCHPDHFISDDYIKNKMPDVDIKHLIDYLISQDLIQYKMESLAGPPIIRRQKKCISYFEDADREKIRKRSDRTHDWLIAIFSAIGGAILSKPLWSVINFILDKVF